MTHSWGDFIYINTLEKLWRTDEVPEFQGYSFTDQLLIFGKWDGPVNDLICDVPGFQVLSQVQQLLREIPRL